MEVRREGEEPGRGQGKVRGEAGRDRDPEIYRNYQTGTGKTAPLDSASGATPNAAGPATRRSAQSLKGDVRPDKQSYSKFIIFIDPNQNRTRFTQ